MSSTHVGGYAGKFLRVDLSRESIAEESFDETTLRKYVGGMSIGAKVLYEEVPPGVAWSDPENRVILASGPLGGTPVGGSGEIAIVTKGSLTNGAASTQAAGFFGAYLKFSGFDGIILHGAAKRPVYLYVHDGVCELKDASHLAGKDTFETDDIIHQELGKEKERDLSVFSIGPAGEKLVKFAGIFGDKGHSASQNGSGAVMGSKKLKAIAVGRGKRPVAVNNKAELSAAAKRMFEAAREQSKGYTYKYGTLWLFEAARAAGQLPVKNWTSNVFPHLSQFDPEWMREHFEVEYRPCWACKMRHCHRSKVTDGPYAGLVVEEPEYAALGAWGPNIGNTDVGTVYMLNDVVDRLGLELGQSSYVISFLMECFEKGILTREDTDGIEMTWGNAEAARAMLRKIASRDGFGDLLAEGIMKTAQRIGGEAPNLAVHTMKGTTTAGSDLRYSWFRMLDACISNAGTKQSPDSREIREAVAELGIPPITDSFSWEQVATFSARTYGRVQFTDSIGVCKWNTAGLKSAVDAVNACTGWDLTMLEAMEVGRRAANLLRAFDIRHGLIPEMEAPSPRMGAAPVDGPAQGKSIAPVIREMRRRYYEEMGWDKETSKPLPDTLRKLGLEHVIADMW